MVEGRDDQPQLVSDAESSVCRERCRFARLPSCFLCKQRVCIHQKGDQRPAAGPRRHGGPPFTCTKDAST